MFPLFYRNSALYIFCEHHTHSCTAGLLLYSMSCGEDISTDKNFGRNSTGRTIYPCTVLCMLRVTSSAAIRAMNSTKRISKKNTSMHCDGNEFNHEDFPKKNTYMLCDNKRIRIANLGKVSPSILTTLDRCQALPSRLLMCGAKACL